MRRRRAGSERSRQGGIKRRGKSLTYPLPEDRWRGQSVPPARQRQEGDLKKKNARLRKKSGVRAVTFYSGLACKSVVVLFVVALFPVVTFRQADQAAFARRVDGAVLAAGPQVRSEEHTSELQSPM